MSIYVISSAKFSSKKKAIEQLEKWDELGNLDEKAKVYEVKKTFKIVKGIQLEEEK